ncbi:DNA polymerase III subunit beta, partial [Mesorhizobium sp. M00.F.Ca.ET.186.01.1.1]
PELSAGSFSHIFRLDSVALKGLIEKTQFAISTEWGYSCRVVDLVRHVSEMHNQTTVKEAATAGVN